MSKFSVTVFCGSSPGSDPAYAQSARELGVGLGERGINLVFGGGNVGLMGVVAGAAPARMSPGSSRIFYGSAKSSSQGFQSWSSPIPCIPASAGCSRWPMLLW